ncbi:MAG: tRNA (adenosine(37)-N6)-threonylcarbamoyltransferase complex ATPase subunit type 1 TsaE, partial [Azoarcus sp.]|nr:tRNA (adenosine(37)-N6)-threonylcarbamoyltransferase complex ATPase subunit type 1 TsaE [Azoarcus sp.]
MMILNEEQLNAYGRRLGAGAGPGAVFALVGELGTGKTTLAKAIAAGLGVATPVTSPTFTLINEYMSGRLPLYHFDVYRLEGKKDLSDLGFEEYLFGGGVAVIEWADRIEGLLPDGAFRIELSYTEDPCIRRVDMYSFIKVNVGLV